MTSNYDVIVIGGGVVGCLTARALSRYQLRILLLEREADVCSGTSKANTAIIHAGYDARPGSLKAALNVAGNRMYNQVCGELGVLFERNGTYVVALEDEDRHTLEELRERGRRNGVPGLSIISAEQMRKAEPLLSEQTRGALFAETGGIVDPFMMTIAAAENAVENGVELGLDTEVTGLELRQGRVVGVKTQRGVFAGNYVVNSAGLYSDRIMAMAGLGGFCIKPRKGEYYVLDREKSQVRQVLFPCPTPVSKGIVVTPTSHGNTLVGPNAVNTDLRDDVVVTRQGLEEVFEGAQRLVPSLDKRDVIAVFAGLRAAGSTGDFLIEAPREVPGLVSLAGIESPGFTAAPAIAERVVDLLRESGLALTPKRSFNPERHAAPRFAELSHRQQQELIERDPRYGRVVCRCEMVTEGEIVAAIHAPVPARTYDGLKRRTRLGAGRCQGGFDTPRVINILARELGVQRTGVSKRGKGSEFLSRGTKEVEMVGTDEQQE